MTVRQTLPDFEPIEVAAPGSPISAGAENDPTDRGIRRAQEAMNWAAGQRPDQHFCMTFGDTDWDGGGECRTVHLPITTVPYTAIDTSVRVNGEFPILRVGMEPVSSVNDTVTMRVDITSETSGTAFISSGVAVLAGVGIETTFEFDLSALAVELGWIRVQIQVSRALGTGVAALRVARAYSLSRISGFTIPENR